MPTFLVLTQAGDLHAADFAWRVRKSRGRCHTVSVDRLSTSSTLSSVYLGTKGGALRTTIADDDGAEVDLRFVDVIWWRRFNLDQKIEEFTELEAEEVDLINQDWRGAIIGAMLSSFRGVWVNDPIATRVAENKLYQMRIASSLGMRVPKTLVSNDPDRVREFCRKLRQAVVVKPVSGTKTRHLFTRKVTRRHLECDEAIRLVPAIYQELVPGSVHLRIHVFGDQCVAVRIESRDLDWRQDLNIQFKEVRISPNVVRKCRCIVKALGLRMGVIDVKVPRDESPVWLEINPQGQFLFSECLSGAKLMEPFVAYMNSLGRRALASRKKSQHHVRSPKLPGSCARLPGTVHEGRVCGQG
jgi:glutathione synthase/RimK-type ligase-like ATP-grasp enzyme